MISPIVSREHAHRKRTHHQFVTGIGYLVHSGPPELPPEANGKKNCAPPTGTIDGTAHMLIPPGGHPPRCMIWIATERAWADPTGKGNRLAWPVDHLMRAGWEFIGPIPAPKKVR